MKEKSSEQLLREVQQERSETRKRKIVVILRLMIYIPFYTACIAFLVIKYGHFEVSRLSYKILAFMILIPVILYAIGNPYRRR